MLSLYLDLYHFIKKCFIVKLASSVLAEKLVLFGIMEAQYTVSFFVLL